MAEKKETGGTSDKIHTIAGYKDCSSSGTLKAPQFSEKQQLIQETSWTKTVPYKYWHSYVKPTDSIGSIFTPGVHTYRTRTLIKRDVKPVRWHPFGIDGVLVSPPHSFIERHNEEVKRRAAALAKKECVPKNIVNLRDLLDDTWLRKKRQKARILKEKELSIHRRKITKRRLDRKVMRDVYVNLTSTSN